jgi:hypothetical protein
LKFPWARCRDYNCPEIIRQINISTGRVSKSFYNFKKKKGGGKAPSFLTTYTNKNYFT